MTMSSNSALESEWPIRALQCSGMAQCSLVAQGEAMLSRNVVGEGSSVNAPLRGACVCVSCRFVRGRDSERRNETE